MKKIKILKLILIPAILLLAGALFFSCDIMSSPVSSAVKNGTLQINLPGDKANSKALNAPINNADFLKRLVYRVECTGPGKVTGDFESGETATLSLATGNWNVKITVFNNADLSDPLGSSTPQPVTIEAGKTSAIAADVKIDTDRCAIKSFALTFDGKKSQKYDIPKGSNVITVYFPYNMPQLPDVGDMVTYSLTHTGDYVTPAPGTSIDFGDIESSSGGGASGGGIGGTGTGTGITVTALDGNTGTYFVVVDRLSPPSTGDSAFTFFSDWGMLPWGNYGLSGIPQPSGSTVVNNSSMAEYYSLEFSEEDGPAGGPGFEGSMILLQGNPTAMATAFGTTLMNSYGFEDYTVDVSFQHYYYYNMSNVDFHVFLQAVNNYLLIMVFRINVDYGDGDWGSGDVWDKTGDPDETWSYDVTFLVNSEATWRDAIAQMNSGKTYKILITDSIYVQGCNSSTSTFKSGVKVTIEAKSPWLYPDIYLDNGQTGSILNIDSTQQVVLRGVDLDGISGNNEALVRTEGIFYMTGASSIYGNENTSGNGGGVYVNGGTFTLAKKSVISGNEAVNGAGVYVNQGIFKMTSEGSVYGDSPIYANKATSQGGGVYVGPGGSFIMYAGSINGSESYHDYARNTASSGAAIFNAGTANYGGGLNSNASINTSETTLQ